MNAFFTATASMLFALAIVAGGCQRALFSDKLPRTQYERYQVLRGQYRPAAMQNAYGGQEPALRERLAPLEQP